MDFQQLLAKIQQLDQPVPEQVASECGEMPPAPMDMSSSMSKPDTPPPSMSVNLNAQGLDNIEELMKLIKAVNPDADKPEMPMGGAPTIAIEPMDKPAGGMPSLGGLGDLDKGPLKMLPDLDADNDNMPGGEIDSMGGDDVSKAQGDLDNDGDHDMDDHDMEKDDSEEKEAFGNSVAGSEPEYGDVQDAVRDGDDLNKPTQMCKRAQPGDNPMAMEGEELRAWIKGELAQRLAEAKGAK